MVANPAVLLPQTNRKTPHEHRFWRKVAIGPGCWEWQAKRDTDGAGQFSMGHRDFRAPRVAWTLVYGEVPARSVLHHCDNPACVRPSHLYLGSHQDNMRDRRARGRSARGEKNRHARLTAAQAHEIWALFGKESVDEVASRYGVNRSTVNRIQSGRIWGHLWRRP